VCLTHKQKHVHEEYYLARTSSCTIKHKIRHGYGHGHGYVHIQEYEYEHKHEHEHEHIHVNVLEDAHEHVLYVNVYLFIHIHYQKTTDRSEHGYDNCFPVTRMFPRN
jgi:hypothetical protein